MIVEALVDGGGPDMHVRMRAAQLLDALGRGEQADEAQVLGAALLQPVDGRHRGVGGREHRVEHQHHAVGEIGRGLEVIFHGLERFRIAIEADMGDARRRHEGQHAVEEADAGAQDRGEDQLLAGDLRAFHRGQRRLDLDPLHGQVAGDLVAEQHADLVEELAEALRRALLVPHQGQLVLNQRMTDHRNALHAFFLFDRR